MTLSLDALVARFEGFMADPSWLASGIRSLTFASHGHNLPPQPQPTLATNHQRLHWAAWVSDMERFVQQCAAIGAPWHHPVFAVQLHLRAGVLSCAAQWWDQPVCTNTSFSTQDYHAQHYGATFARRLDALAAQPQGDDLWTLEGPMGRSFVVQAADHHEAWMAGRALRWGGHRHSDDLDRQLMGEPCRHVTLDALPLALEPYTGPSPMTLLRKGIASMRKATHGWLDHPGHQPELGMRIATSIVYDPHTQTHTTSLSHEDTFESFDPDDLQGYDADAAYTGFGMIIQAVEGILALPGLVGAPVGLALEVHLMPGGTVGLGFDLTLTDEDMHHLLDIHEPKQVIALWDARLSPLLHLTPSHKRWVFPAHHDISHGYVVSGNTPEEAAQAAQCLWRWKPSHTTIGALPDRAATPPPTL